MMKLVCGPTIRFLASILVATSCAACGRSGQQPQTDGGTSGSEQIDTTTQDTSPDTSPPRVERGWSEMQAIGARINQFSLEMSVPVVATNGKGQALVAWTSTHTENEPRHPRLRAAIYRDGAWQPAFEVTPQPAQDPVVAINDQGDMVISYLRLDHSSSKVLTSEERWAVVARNWEWKEPQRVGHVAPTGIDGLYGHEADLALDAKGNALLAFKQSGTQPGLFVAYYSGGAWGAASRVDKTIPSHVHTFDLAGNDAGQAMLVWLDQQVGQDAKGEEERTLLLKSKTFANGAGAGEQALGQGWKVGAGGSSGPWVRIDGKGNAVALYIEEDADKKATLSVQDYLGQSKSWSEAKALWSAQARGELSRASIAMSQPGDIAVAWTLNLPDDKAGGRLSYRGSAKGEWSEIMDFVAQPSGLEGGLQLTMDEKGLAWIGWDQPKVDTEHSYHVRSYELASGLGATERPLGGTHFVLRASSDGTVFAVSRRTVIGNNPLGYYSVPTAAVYTPGN